MNKLYYWLWVPIVALFVLGLAAYFPFNAEDSYIPYRYARNLVEHQALVFNLGEPINAMTSPLQAFVAAALLGVTGDIVITYKLLAVFLFLVAAGLIVYRFRERRDVQLLVGSLVLLPPCILLWTVGGLETPLLLFLVTVIVLYVDSSAHFDLKTLTLTVFGAGIAFLTRYDSALFFAPVVLYGCIRARSLRNIVIALLLGGALPLLWLAISVTYYGDLMPTSFYVKEPNALWDSLRGNARYILSYLFFVGIIPLVGLFMGLTWNRRNASELLGTQLRRRWWLGLGLALELCYGLTMATVHMMFSFRFFVPYIPVTVLLVAELLRARLNQPDPKQAISRNVVLAFTVFALAILLFEGFQLAYVYFKSINGLISGFEYSATGVTDYVTFMNTLQKEAVDMEQHWAQAHPNANRPPRISTYAAGILPYTYSDVYVYEKLISYRHCVPFSKTKVQPYQTEADYIHTLTPLIGPLETQLAQSPDTLQLVSSDTVYFEGQMQSFQVYYNPNPAEHTLSAGMNGMCH